MKDTEEQMEETVGIEEEERKQETRRIAEEQQSIEDGIIVEGKDNKMLRRIEEE